MVTAMSVKPFRGWSARRWLAVTLCMVVASFASGGVMDVLTDSLWIHILVSVILSVLVMWASLAWMRVLLRNSQEAVKKNPRPW